MPDYTMKNFYDQRKYEDAIEYASDATVRESFSEWDYVFLSMCVYKLERYSDFLDLYKEFHNKFPESDKLNDNMGWSLYHTHIKSFDFETGNRDRYLRQVDYIISNTTDSRYSPKTWVATMTVNAIFNQKMAANINYELADKYLSVIDPLSLDTTEHEITIDGKIRRTASDREQWYTRKAKTLVKLGKYEECLSCVEKALEDITNFHNRNNHWLNFRKAQCYFGLRDLENAEKTIAEILNSKFEHWCFYEQMFDIAVEKNNSDDAIRYGAICSLTDREHKLRVSFYEKYALFLLANGYPREAALLFRLVEMIRDEESWKGIPLPEGFTYPEDILDMDKKAIIKELVSFWKQKEGQGLVFYEGEIARVLPNGGSGFIRADDGNSYYFNARDFTTRVNEFREGERVRFTLVERLDKSKNKMKLNAVQINFVR